MGPATIAPALDRVPLGAHVSSAVDDGESYLAGVDRLLSLAQQRNEKPLLFGPEGRTPPAGLTGRPAAWADPRTAFLDGGSLVPAAMFSAFGHQVEVARREGYSGVMVVADMDWLLPLELSVDELVSFELLLDRCISELGATVVCAYRRVSFGPEVLMGASCVHPVDAGGQRPPFRLVAGLPGAWRLSGEIDIGVADHFEAALEAATSCGHCDIDVSDLEFIDVSGLRAIARAASSCGIRLFNAPAIVRRAWQVSGLADEGPAVRFVAPALEP